MEESHEHFEERSIWPILLAVGLTLLVIGVVSSLVISGLGIIILLFALGGWAQENRTLAQQYPSEEMDEEGDQ